VNNTTSSYTIMMWLLWHRDNAAWS